MSSLVKSIFGGTDNSAQKAQTQANERTQQFIEEQAGLARDDVLRYIPQGADAARRGYEDAYGLMSKVGGEQVGLVRGGNMRAQQTLLAGLPQMQNAIMGNPIDNDALGGVQRMGHLNADMLRDYPMSPRPPIDTGQAQQTPQMAQEQLIQLLLGGMR